MLRGGRVQLVVRRRVKGTIILARKLLFRTRAFKHVFGNTMSSARHFSPVNIAVFLRGRRGCHTLNNHIERRPKFDYTIRPKRDGC